MLDRQIDRQILDIATYIYTNLAIAGDTKEGNVLPFVLIVGIGIVTRIVIRIVVVIIILITSIRIIVIVIAIVVLLLIPRYIWEIKEGICRQSEYSFQCKKKERK